MVLQLRPSEIHYSQDSISCRFSNDKRIGETLDELCEGRISVSDIKPVCVAHVRGQWFTWDNRRLWVFRQLERLGKCERIPVRLKDSIDNSRFTTKCNGDYVVVRGEPGGFWYKQRSNSLISSSAAKHSVGSSSTRVPSRRRPPNSSPSYGLLSESSTTTDTTSIIDTLWSVAEIGLGIGALIFLAAVKK